MPPITASGSISCARRCRRSSAVPTRRDRALHLESPATGAWLADGVAHSSADGTARGAPPPGRRRKARRWRWVALGGVLAVGAVSAYHWSARGPAPPQFITAPVTRGAVAVALTATGTVNPVTVVEVGTYVSGPIVRWYCDFNTSVKVGQLCAQIDPRPFQMVADQAAANLAVAKAPLIKDQASLAYAKTTYERDVGLLARGIVSQATLDSEKSAYEQAAAQIAYDQSSIQERQAELSAANVNLGFSKIISPVNGAARSAGGVDAAAHPRRVWVLRDAVTTSDASLRLAQEAFAAGRGSLLQVL